MTILRSVCHGNSLAGNQDYVNMIIKEQLELKIIAVEPRHDITFEFSNIIILSSLANYREWELLLAK